MTSRDLGKTGHAASLATFGAAALAGVDSSTGRAAFETAFDRGVGQIDVAPSYGDAEEKLGAFLGQFRDQVFVSCKTLERTAKGAEAELKASLATLGTDRFDNYQFHAVTSDDELDAILAPSGALKAVTQARGEGLLSNVGITGHHREVPKVFLRAIDEIELDTVMFPINASLWAVDEYRLPAERLLAECSDRGIGVFAIKAVAAGYWGAEKTHHTWYRPLQDPADIDPAVSFVLSQPIASLVTPGDVRLLEPVLDAVDRFANEGPIASDLTPRQDHEPLLGPPG